MHLSSQIKVGKNKNNFTGDTLNGNDKYGQCRKDACQLFAGSVSEIDLSLGSNAFFTLQ